jgi:hypothetical protein
MGLIGAGFGLSMGTFLAYSHLSMFEPAYCAAFERYRMCKQKLIRASKTMLRLKNPDGSYTYELSNIDPFDGKSAGKEFTALPLHCFLLFLLDIFYMRDKK